MKGKQKEDFIVVNRIWIHTDYNNKDYWYQCVFPFFLLLKL